MILATATLQFVRVINGVAGVFPNDPAISTAALHALPSWMTSGRASQIAVWIGVFTATGTRVPNVTATIGGYFYVPASLFGLPTNTADAWFDADTKLAQPLDKPAVFDVSYQVHMGVRIELVVDPTLTATQIRISVQEMPR